MKYTARYRRKGMNPFVNSLSEKGPVISASVDIDESMPLARVKQLAKDATPEGYTFIEVTLKEKNMNLKEEFKKSIFEHPSLGYTDITEDSFD